MGMGAAHGDLASGAPLAVGADAFAAHDALVAAALQRTRAELQQLGPIPRVLHVTAKKNFDPWLDHPFLRHGVQAFMKMNPRWELRIHDDAALDRLLKVKLPVADYARVKGAHIVERGDLWRLLLMYYEGGMYVDLDRLSNVQMHRMYTASGKLKMVMPAGRNDFAQDFVCSAPRNPVLWTAINLNLARRKACANSKKKLDEVPGWAPSGIMPGKLCSIYHFGPVTYLNALSSHVLGKQLQRRPKTNHSSESLFEQALPRLHELEPYAMTYRETPPFDTILFRAPAAGDPPLLLFNQSTQDEGWQDRVRDAIQSAKRDFYKVQGLGVFWSGQGKNLDRHLQPRSRWAGAAPKHA